MASRSQKLLEATAELGQVFLTSTDERALNWIPLAASRPRKFFIKQGAIDRVENATYSAEPIGSAINELVKSLGIQKKLQEYDAVVIGKRRSESASHSMTKRHVLCRVCCLSRSRPVRGETN